MKRQARKGQAAPERRCSECGREVVAVVTESGERLNIDAIPMRTVEVRERDNTRVRVRADGFYNSDLARRMPGWRIVETRAKSVLGTMTFVERGELKAARYESIYSDHRLTCTRQPSKFFAAMFDLFGGAEIGEAPADVKQRDRMTWRIQRLVEQRPECWKTWGYMTPRGQLKLFWSPRPSPRMAAWPREMLFPQTMNPKAIPRLGDIDTRPSLPPLATPGPSDPLPGQIGLFDREVVK